MEQNLFLKMNINNNLVYQDYIKYLFNLIFIKTIKYIFKSSQIISFFYF